MKLPIRRKATARMKAQDPCGEHCVGSRHLHLEPDHNVDQVEVILVGWGELYADQYLKVTIGKKWFTLHHSELVALAAGLTQPWKPRRRK